MSRKITLILPVLLLGLILNTRAQCPPNIDWELGTYSNWLYYTGTVTGSGLGPTTITVASSGGPTAGRHTITSGTGLDPYGFFPVVAPGGGTYSFKLGDNVTGAQAERVRYNLHVPTGGVYSLLYHYAVVLEDPVPSHSPGAQPRMIVKAYDSITGVIVPCDSYLYVAASSIPGFLNSSTLSNVRYKTWTMGNMKFPGYGGRTVVVEFTTADCSYGGHFGYGYLDMTCGFFANSTIGCASGSTVLAGPDGYANYTWYDSATFSTVYGTSEIVTISAPTVATTYAVILHPFAGYGCDDTLYTKVIPSTLVLTASNDTAICSGSSAILAANATSSTPPITFSWAPITGLSCTTCGTVTATPTVTTTYTVTARDGAGCTKVKNIVVTVVPTPAPITGPSTVCPGTSITLSDAVIITSSTWSGSPSPTIATIGASSGIVTGNTAGIFNVTYTNGGICPAYKTVTVNSAPLPIVPGSPHVCVGTCGLTLTDPTPGGTWSEVFPSTTFASVGSSSGVVCGLSTGTANITYTVASTGCYATRAVTVDPLPGLIGSSTGSFALCINQSTNLSSLPSGGTWSASNGRVTVGSSSGTVTGVSAGLVTVTYTTAAGCFTIANMTVNPSPGPITGPDSMCEGSSVTLSDTSTSILWSSSNTTIAYFGTPPTLSGLSAGVDTVYATYSASGCWSMMAVTVEPTPPVPTGTTHVCIGSVVLLTDPAVGIWSSSNPLIATVGSTSGVVTGITAGVDTIYYTSPYGCRNYVLMSVYPPPATPTGPGILCRGTTITLTDATTPGTFSTTSGGAATVTPSGTVTGVSLGTQTITYTATATGCTSTTVVTVTPVPSPITGAAPLCPGICETLVGSPSGGTWSSSNPSVVSIGATSGSACGGTVGATSSATITYSLGTGCSVNAVIVVNPQPSITPASPHACANGGTTTLGSSPLGGTWSSTPATVGSVSSTGVVTGFNPGALSVTNTAAGTGCSRTVTVNINAAPLPIVGASDVCVNGFTTFSDPTGGGTWSSLSPSTGSIAPPAAGTSATVWGVSAGSVAIVYSVTATGCTAVKTLSVNALPLQFTITSTTAPHYCAGGAGIGICLSGSQSGVNYQLLLSGVPVGSPVPGTGSSICFGAQTAPGTYTVAATGTSPAACTRAMLGTVNVSIDPQPSLSSGSVTSVCVGNSIVISGSLPGGTWTVSTPAPPPAVTMVTAGSSATVTGIRSGGYSIVTYTMPTGCSAQVTVNVASSPSFTAPSNICASTCTNLTGSPLGGIWSTSSPTVASIGSSSGTLCGISAGPTTITYTLGSTSGCSVTQTVGVTSVPAPATGPTQVCIGSTVTECDATPGGTWSLDPASLGIASVVTGPGGCGTVYGISGGVATISYTAACSVTRQITVNSLPVISGPLGVCEGTSITLSASPSSGTWTSSNTAIARVTAGVVSGVLAGSANITFVAAGTSCSSVVTVNVTRTPTSITGAPRVCQNSTTTLSSTPSGGTWTVGSSGIASITPSGVLTGLSAGTTTVTYMLSGGCYIPGSVTINPIPSPIIGPGSVCQGHQVNLTDPSTSPAGTWSSSNITIATVGGTTGVVTGNAPGVATIAYTFPVTGCSATTSFSVIATPATIVGTTNICVGGTTTLVDPTPGGTWTSSLPSVATIGSGTGLVTGIASGTSIISYNVGVCPAAMAIVVNPLSTITGNFTVCAGQTTHLIDTALGGIWSSTPTSIATVDASGTVTGVSPSGGLATISYTRLGCVTSQVVTVNAIPAPITGTLNACVGQTSLLSSSPAGGTWTSSPSAVASISGSGLVTANSAGTAAISYALPSTGCYTTAMFTVNGLPTAISGPSQICVGSTVTYAAGGTGTWTSSAPSVAVVNPTTGAVTGISAGSTTIVFALGGSGCSSSKTVLVGPPPPDITGPDSVCMGATVALSNSVSGGSWSSSTTSIGTVDAAGNVTGVGVGTTNITYSLGPSCDSHPFTVSVNLTPFPITPSGPNICAGDSVFLTDPTPGGTWSSSASTVASIDPTGLVIGLSAGTSILGYTTAHGCGTNTYVTVNSGPLPISGSNLVCVGSMTNLFDGTPGGTWSSSNTAVASVDPAGNVSGLTPGIAIIAYTVGGYVCPAVQVMAVNAPPAPVTGPTDVCQGSSATLSDVSTGGVWSSSSPGTISVGSSSGVVSAVATGATMQIPVTITYSTGPLGTGCDVNYVVNANPVPTPVTGPGNVCTGQVIVLSDATVGGTWSSASTSIATVAPAGTSVSVTGVAGGTVDISYTNSYSCAAVQNITVNPTPTPIAGSANVCLGGTSDLSTTPGGGTWLSLNTAIATVGATTGRVSGVSLGSTTIVYTTAAGCSAFKTVFVQPLPVIYSVTGGGNHCPSDPGVHIGLSSSSIGVSYMVYRGSTAVGSYAGTGGVLDFGLFTVGGTYTVVATTMATGCSVSMSGSAFINVLTPVTPSVRLNVTPNDTVCAGTSTSFTPTTVNGGSAPTFVWKVNGSAVATSTNYNFIPADRDIVTVEMTSNAQCPIPATVSASMTMTVLPYGRPNVAIVATPNDSICRGDAVTMRAASDFGGTAPVYTWVKNTYSVPGITGPAYTFMPNTYDSVWAYVTSNYQCLLSNRDTSNTVYLTVVNPVTPVVSISGNSIVGKGRYDTLKASVAGAVAPTFQWYINGLPVPGATNATFVHNNFSYPKADSVSVQVTTHGICELTAHQWMFIQSTTVGVNTLTTEGGLTVVPNPNKGEFTIKGSLGAVNDEEVSIEMTNMIGQVVYKSKVTAKGGKLDEHVSLGKHLANGMYMLSVRSESESQLFHIVVEQ